MRARFPNAVAVSSIASCLVLIPAITGKNAAIAQDVTSLLRGSLAEALVDLDDDPIQIQSAVDAPRQGSGELDDDIRERATATERDSEFPQIMESEADNASAERKERTPDANIDENGEPSEVDGDSNFDVAIELRSGFDTNYDEEVEAVGTVFSRADISISANNTVNDTQLLASADATFLHLKDLDIAERFSAEAAIGAVHQIGDDVSVLAAASASVDGLDTTVSTEKLATLGIQVVRPQYSYALRGGVGIERDLFDREFEEDDDRDDDDNGEDLNGSSDLLRGTVDASAVLLRNRQISPILSVRGSRLDYFRTTLLADDDDTLVRINRDAYDLELTSGIRVRPSDRLTVTVAARYSKRHFDDPTVPSLELLSPSVWLAIEIANDLNLNASYARFIDEPEEDGGFAQDTQAYSVELEYEPDEGFSGSILAGYSRFEEYGVESTSDEWLVAARLAYQFGPNAAADVSVSHTRGNDKTEDEQTKRTEFSAAVELKF